MSKFFKKEMITDILETIYWSFNSLLFNIFNWIVLFPIFCIAELIKFIRYELPFRIKHFAGVQIYGDISDNIKMTEYIISDYIIKDKYKNYKKALFSEYPWYQNNIIQNIAFTALKEFREIYMDRQYWGLEIKDDPPSHSCHDQSSFFDEKRNAGKVILDCYKYIEQERKDHFENFKKLSPETLWSTFEGTFADKYSKEQMKKAKEWFSEKVIDTADIKNIKTVDDLFLAKAVADGYSDSIIKEWDRKVLAKIISIVEHLND